MITHPSLLATAAFDAIAVILLALAVWTKARLLIGTSNDEREASSSRLARWALASFSLASIIYLVSLTLALPDAVPGAMCGTGVVQASEGLVQRALGLRILTLALLGAWSLHDTLRGRRGASALAPTATRILLLAAPVLVLAALDSGRSILALDEHAPVDCCAAVFGQVAETVEAGRGSGMSDEFLLGSTGALAAWILMLAVWLLVSPGKAPLRRSGLLGMSALIFVPLAAMATVKVFAAYIYGDADHLCPWCLFLPEHGLVGYGIFAALLLILLDGPAAFLAARSEVGLPELQGAGLARMRKGTLRLILALALFIALTGGPALLWRFGHGTWL